MWVNAARSPTLHYPAAEQRAAAAGGHGRVPAGSQPGTGLASRDWISINPGGMRYSNVRRLGLGAALGETSPGCH